jgi:ElaA protein
LVIVINEKDVSLELEPIPWTLKTFDQLNNAELYAILAARAKVFVIEQRCFYEDADFSDAKCRHLFTQDSTGKILAYARLVPPGVKFAEASIGRVMCSEFARGKGMARALMQAAIEAIARCFGHQNIRIGAQHYLEAFYQSLGFQTMSDVFDEDGIPHVEMLFNRDKPES